MDRLVETYRVDIESNEAQIQQLEKYRAEYVSVADLLRKMPLTLNPKVLIPMGSKCGFMYGHLKHTNEIMAHLGDNYFNRMTAAQAGELVAKRIKELDDHIALLRGSKKHLDERLDIATELFSKNSHSKEITEPYDEEAEKEWIAKHKASVAREREAARKEREKHAGNEEDPLTKLLQMKDDDGEQEEEDDDEEEEEEEEDESSEEDDEEEDEDEAPETPNARKDRRGSIEKRVKWDLEAPSTTKPVEPLSKREYNHNIHIRFSHSSASPLQGSIVAASSSEIQSPSDIYKVFLPRSQPKSILKKTSNLHRASSAPVSSLSMLKDDKKATAALQPPSMLPPSTAVSEKVVERVPAPLTENTQANAGARPVSKFRKERNIQN